MSDKLLYGIDKDLHARMAARWDPENAKAALAWISELSGDKLDADFHAALKDGVALCKAINRIQPGAVKKINNMKMPFMQRENIVAFVDAIKAYGVKDVFVTQDLFEGDNLPSVLDTIFALGGVAQAKGFSGPKLGIRQSVKAGGGVADSKFTVSSTGGGGVPLLATGSVARDGNSSTLAHQIVKTGDTGAGGVPLLATGGIAHGANKSLDRQIVKTGDTGAAGAVPRLAAGGVAHAANPSLDRQIVKTGAHTGADVPTRLDKGGAAFDPTANRMDSIIRNPAETRAQSGAGAAGAGAKPTSGYTGKRW